MCPSLSEVLSRVERLVSPPSQEDTGVAPEDWSSLMGENHDGGDGPPPAAARLDALLRRHLPSTTETEQTDVDLRWAFVRHALSTLGDLRTSLSAGAHAAGAHAPTAALLSVKQQRHVSSLLQLTVALGALPALMPGVGLPLEQRSRFVQWLRRGEDGREDAAENYRRLVHITNSLLKFSEEKQLSNVIMTKHLGDLMASLVQLGYAPLKKPTSSASQSTSADAREDSPSQEPIKPAAFVMTEEMFEKLTAEQAYFRQQLAKVIGQVYQPLVVKYLLVIQSCGASSASSSSSASTGATKSSPKWLKRVCGQLLSALVMKKDGVLNVIKGVLDVGGISSEAKSAEVMQTQKYEVIAQVLSHPPSTKYSDVESYYAHICPQLLSILDLSDESETKQFHMICCACIKAITERSLILSRRHLLDVIMEPLLRMSTDSADAFHPISESALEKCLRQLHLIFVQGNDPSSVFVHHLEPVVVLLLELHGAMAFSKVSHLRQPVAQLVERYLKCVADSDAIAALKTFAFRQQLDAEEGTPRRRLRLMRRDIKISSGDSGGLKVDCLEDADEADMDTSFYVTDDEKSIALVDLVQESLPNLSIEFFMSLLKDLSDVMGEAGAGAGEPREEREKSVNSRLLDFEKDLDRTMDKMRKNLMIIRLTGLLSEDERLQQGLMKDSGRLLDFVCMTVERGALQLDSNEEDASDAADDLVGSQSLTMALTLLSVRLTQKDVSTDEWRSLQRIATHLKTLARGHKVESVRTMSRKLGQLIATHGIILDHKDNMDAKVGEINSKVDKMRNLTERLRQLKTHKDGDHNEDEDGEGEGETSQSRTRYQQSLQELVDPLLPVRGHALIELTKLVEEKDKETMDNIKKVIGIFKDNLEDDDTYLYLQAINGLVACANHDPAQIVDLLTREFGQLDDRKHASGDKAVELRTKVGEALVRVTKNLHQMTPKFKNQLLNPFLGNLGHPDFLVRASCLSNLGEVCKNLKFSLGGILEEIFQQLHQVLQCDPSIEVRRAAVLVVTLLLQGLGKDVFRVMADQLKDIWRTLRLLRDTETDGPMLTHVSEALHQIDDIVKNFLQPQQQLKKNIYVLDAPPEPF